MTVSRLCPTVSRATVSTPCPVSPPLGDTVTHSRSQRRLAPSVAHVQIGLRP
jgi:hypothetical protein